MADRIRGITVEINGDTTGLSKALSGVNSQIKTTQSQLKDVEKLLKLDPKNTELLRQKQVLLAKAIAETKTKVDTLKAAEQQMAADPSVDKNSEKYMGLKREIIAAESALKEYQNTQNGTSTGTQSATSSLKLFSAEMMTATGKAVALATGIVTLGKKLASFSTDTAAKADDILTQSSITGLSTTLLQELDYAAPFLDVDVSDITSAMRRNIRSMSSAKEGTGSAAEAYKQLGISVTNAQGQLRDSETIFWEVVAALGSVQNETERDAIAMELFGKSAQDLNPLIEAGRARFEELAQAAHEAGYVMSEETLSSMGAVQDQVDSLKLSIDGLKQALGIETSGVVSGGINYIRQRIDTFKEENMLEKYMDLYSLFMGNGIGNSLRKVITGYGFDEAALFTAGSDSKTEVNITFNGSLSKLAEVLEPAIQMETARKGGSVAK